jgi:hypothetical protein
MLQYGTAELLEILEIVDPGIELPDWSIQVQVVDDTSVIESEQSKELSAAALEGLNNLKSHRPIGSIPQQKKKTDSKITAFLEEQEARQKQLAIAEKLDYELSAQISHNLQYMETHVSDGIASTHSGNAAIWDGLSNSSDVAPHIIQQNFVSCPDGSSRGIVDRFDGQVRPQIPNEFVRDNGREINFPRPLTSEFVSSINCSDEIVSQIAAKFEVDQLQALSGDGQHIPLQPNVYNGLLGERIAHFLLTEKYGSDCKVFWVNDPVEQGLPYDIEVFAGDKLECRYEVKTRAALESETLSQWFFSYDEFCFAERSENQYACILLTLNLNASRNSVTGCRGHVVRNLALALREKSASLILQVSDAKR